MKRREAGTTEMERDVDGGRVGKRGRRREGKGERVKRDKLREGEEIRKNKAENDAK